MMIKSIMLVGLLVCMILPSQLQAQKSLYINTSDKVRFYQQLGRIGKQAIAAENDSATGPNWKLVKYDVDLHAGRITHPRKLADSLTQIYDAWLDMASDKVTFIAEKDTAITEVAQPLFFVQSTGVEFFTHEVAGFFYPYFDASGYTGCKTKAGDIAYIRHNNTEINFTQDPGLKTLNIDSLFPINEQGLSVIHNSTGYMLFNTNTKLVLTGALATMPWQFAPDRFADTIGNILIVTKGITAGQVDYLSVRLIKGKQPCLLLRGKDSAYHLRSVHVDSIPLAGYVASLDTVMGYPFQDKVLIRSRRQNKDHYVSLNLNTQKTDTIIVLSVKDKIQLQPFYERLYLSVQDNVLRITGLKGKRVALSKLLFKSFYKIRNCKADSTYFFAVTGNDTTLQINRIAINNANHKFTIREIYNKGGTIRVKQAFRNNTLMAMTDDGWLFFDGVNLCNKGHKMYFDNKPVKTEYYYDLPQSTIDLVYDFSDSPLPNEKQMLIHYKNDKGAAAGFKTLRLRYNK